MSLCRCTCSAIHLSSAIKVVGINPVFINRIAAKLDGRAVEIDQRPIIARTCIIIRCQIMGEINHEP
jgi:hypothetical protein